MANATTSTTVGVFETRGQAQQAVNELKSLGFQDEQIGLVARDASSSSTDGGSTARTGLQDDPTGTRWEEGTGIGAVAGAATGTGLGLAVAVGLLTPLGPIIAGGALIALIASVGAGATVGTIVGGLVGLGVPEEDAAYYDSEVQAGRYVVTVHAGKRAAEVQALFRRYEGYDRSTASTSIGGASRVASGATDTSRSTTAATTGAAGQTVKLHEEQLKANKERVQTGSVDVRKEVRTEQKTITVPVQHEEIVIERRSVNQAGRTGDIKAEEIRIPVSEERVTVGKETVVKEEVKVGKRTVTGNETVSGEVRSEELIVETDGKAKIRDDRSGRKS